MSDDIVDFGSDLEELSIGVAIVLGITYVAGLLFSLYLRTATSTTRYEEEAHETFGWSVRRSIAMLAVAAPPSGWSPRSSSARSPRPSGRSASEFFVGVIVVAVVGNAAEHGRGARRSRTRWTSR